MSGGVSYNSKLATAAISSTVNGTVDANYPLANLLSLINISNVSRITAAGGQIELKLTWPAAITAQCFALIHPRFENPPSGVAVVPANANFQFRAYSDAAWTTLVHNSGSVALWPTGAAPVANYNATRPYVPAAPVTMQSAKINITGLTTGQVYELGGLEVADWWSWNVSPGAEIGFSTRATERMYVGGASEAEDIHVPRVFNGQIDYLALPTAQTTGVDFQLERGKSKPFVFAQDYDDPTTWPRACMLARNQEIPGSVGAMYRHDRFQFRFTEHWR